MPRIKRIVYFGLSEKKTLKRITHFDLHQTVHEMPLLLITSSSNIHHLLKSNLVKCLTIPRFVYAFGGHGSGGFFVVKLDCDSLA